MVVRKRSGRVVEQSTVWVPYDKRPRMGRVKGSTSAAKQAANDRDAIKRLARVLNANFAHGDLWVTLNYSEDGLAELHALAEKWGCDLKQAAERDAENFIRRLRRVLGKEIVFRWVLVTSDMDGDTGEAVRIHHHLVVPRASFEQVAKIWTHGTVDYQLIKDRDDHTALAVYLLRQVRRKPDAKKYRTSRNMQKPIVSRRWAKPGEELRPDRGGRVTGRSAWDGVGPQYIRFVADKRKGGNGRE